MRLGQAREQNDAISSGQARGSLQIIREAIFSELIINGGYTSPRMSDTTATSSVTEVADELDSDDSNSTCLSHSSSSPVKQKPSAGQYYYGVGRTQGVGLWSNAPPLTRVKPV